MRQLETSSLSNQNISAYLLVHTFTADEARAIFARVHLDQVAGGGDYSIYATLQAGGTGSAFMEGPITTFTVPAAQTAIGFVSILIPVNSGDVVKFYVKGLAGDTTTPDIVTRIFELTYLRPTVPGRTLDVDANGGAEVGAIQADAINAAAIAADAVTEIQAGLSTLNAAGVRAAVGLASANLDTQLAALQIVNAAAIVTAGVTGSTLTIYNYATNVITLTGLPDFTGYKKLWFTVKRSKKAVDSAALIHMVLSAPAEAGSDGLIYINGIDATKADGFIEVLSSTSIKITLNSPAAALLAEMTGAFYGVKKLIGTDPSPVSEGGVVNIEASTPHAMA